MNPELIALMTAQGGVFTRRQAQQTGCSEREIKTRTGSRGDWSVVRRGVYSLRSCWQAGAADERYRLQVRAALVAADVPAVASHASAAAFLGMPMRPRWRELVHFTRPDVRGGRVEGGVSHHSAAYDAVDTTERDGLQLTSLGRTAVDIGREHGFEDGVVAADAALRLGATRAELWHTLDRMTCWPHVTRARAAVKVADGGADGVGETLTRLLVLELGIGTPETQFMITDGTTTAYADLRVGRHLFEFDGRVKYVGRERGGVAERSPEDVVWKEKLREDWIRGQEGGYGMSRVVWSNLWGAERERTKQRLRREYDETCRRLGRELER